MDETPSFEYVTPPADPAPAPIRPRIFGLPRFAVGLAAGAVLLIAAGAAAVTIFLLAAGHGTVLDRMVPAGVAAYASINLDPPADQKLDLLNLSHKLPKLSSDKDLDKSLDQVLSPLGLTYASDVKPWLGAQVVALVGSGSKPEGAVLIDSKDDSAAQGAVAKVMHKYSGAGWHDAAHGGVTLHVGSQSGQPIVIGYFDHTLLVAASEPIADEIIDTDQGKHARLEGTAEYRAITGRLPSSRLVTVFVDGQGLSGWASKLVTGGFASGLSLGTVSPPPVSSSSVDQSLQAFRGAGFAVAAQSDGLVADVETDLDTSKLTPDQRAIYSRTAGANPALQHVPAGAVAVVGLTDLDLVAKSLSAAPATGALLPPQVAQAAQRLTGDAAVEVESEGSTFAAGGVIGTSDPQGLKAILQQLSGSAESLTPSVYFATAGQDLLVATSSGELAKLQGAAPDSFTTSAGFRQADSYAVANASMLVYVDVDAAFRMASSFGLGSSSEFQQARSDWSAVHRVLVTTGTSSARVHVVIG